MEDTPGFLARRYLAQLAVSTLSFFDLFRHIKWTLHIYGYDVIYHGH
jgi:hypothetical protein